MRRAILFLAVIVITCPWLLAVTYPQLVVGGGYECVIIIANPRATGFTGRLELRKGNGVLWNTPFTVNDQAYSGSSVPITLAPFATGKFVLRSNTLQIGYLDLLGREGSNGSDVAVSFFYNFLSGGTLVESTGIPNSSISRGHVFGVEHSSRVNTALAWCSFYPTDPFDITLTLYDAAGVQVQQKVYSLHGSPSSVLHRVIRQCPGRIRGPCAHVLDARLGADRPTIRASGKRVSPDEHTFQNVRSDAIGGRS